MKLTTFSAASAVTVLSLTSAAASLTEFSVQNPLLGLKKGGQKAQGGNKPVPGESPFTLCDVAEERLLDIEYVNIDPNPPTRGANLTIEASGNLKKKIEPGAYVELDVRYGYIRLLHQTVDLCEQTDKVDMKCPLDEGQQTVKKFVELPNEIPPGKYLVNARAFTKDDEEITCLSATVEFPYELSNTSDKGWL